MLISEPTKILVRNADVLAGRHILVIDSPGGELATAVTPDAPDAQFTLLQSDYADFQVARRVARDMGIGRCEAKFGAASEAPPPDVDLVIIYLPKGRLMREFVFSMVAGAVGPSVKVLVTGPGRGGIRAAKKTLEMLFTQVEKLDTARHCVLYSAMEPLPGEQPPRRLEDWCESFDFEIAGENMAVRSYPGVFCHGRLDDGTRMLLESLDTVPNGPVLDFGCGCGVIGAWIHWHWPKTKVRMVDSSALAVEAARKTAELHGLPPENVFPSDVFSDVDGQYQMIISNPSFHSGHKTDHETAERFLAAAGDRLNPGGVLRIVANRFLPYRPLIERHVGRCKTVVDDERYRVYEAVKAPR